MNTYFLVASLRRSGSSYLSLELDSYENVFCQFEHLYRKSKYKQPAHIVIDGKDFSFRDSIDKLSKGEKFRGTKLPIPEYQPDDVPVILNYLRSEPIKIIHIIRNFHESMVSILRAKKTGVWLVHDDRKSEVPDWMKGDERHKSFDSSKHEEKEESLFLTEDLVDEYCRNALSIDKGIASLRESNDYYQVNYIDIHNSIEEILEFIGAYVNKSKLPKKIRFQTPEKIIKNKSSDIINNWNLVRPKFEHWESLRDYIV